MLATHTQVKSSPAMAPQARQFVQITPDLELPGFTMQFERDEEVFGEGESADFVYRVVSGVVRIHRILDDGRRQISGFYFAGDLFGLELGEEHTTSAEAVCSSEIALVKRVAIERMTADDSSAACKLWGLTSLELRRAQAHLMLLGRKTAVERVASFLIEMASRQSDKPGGVSIPMSRTDIADYLGLTIETVSRTLSQLERDGMIALPSCRQIVLRDRRALVQAQS